jgi:dTDP-4-dehydrorhamnose reductase
MLRLAGERDELRVVGDQHGTPTPAALIADVTAQVLARTPARLPSQSGLWHLTPTGQTTWHGFAEAIVERAHALGLIPRHPRVVPIATADYPTPAMRPAYSVLDCSALQHDFGIALPDWQEGLALTLDTLAAGR